MRLFKPLQALWRRWRSADKLATLRRQAQARTRQRERLAEVELFPRIYDTRLEDRQLLDATPLAQLSPNGVLTVNAGAQAGDGSADQFEIREIQGEQGSEYSVAVNGASAGSFSKSSVQQIQVQGSRDADTLVFDSSLTPSGGLVFEGAGGAADPHDQLVLQWTGGNLGPTHVHHALGVGQGSIHATWGESLPGSYVTYVGVEQVDDGWQSESRSFELADGVSAELTGGVSENRSRLQTSVFADSTGTVVDFVDPARSLSITALGAPQSQSGDSQSADTPRLSVVGTVAIRGGDIRLDAGDQGFLNVSATVSTRNDQPGGRGGNIDLLGDRVFVRSGSTIDVSGAGGGGQVRLGGDFQGTNPDVRNATQVLLEEGAAVTADGLGAADGGRVIIWSDDIAVVWGTISVGGGETAGDGGFVETSGKRFIDIRHAPNLRAPNGRGGSWLIDPNDIEIKNATTANITITGSSITTTDDTAVLDIDDLEDALDAGNVTISTSTAGANSQPGNITLSVDLNYNGLGTATLTLNAHNDIILNGEIFDNNQVSSDRLGLILNADSDNNGSGVIRLAENISTRGGVVTFQDDVILQNSLTINSAGGNVTFQGTVNADDAATQNRALTVTAGTGTVTFGASVGQAANGELADLDVTGSTISLADNVTVNDGPGGATVTFTGAVRLAGDVTITTDGINDNGLTFASGSTINADDASVQDRRLTIRAGTQSVSFGGAVGTATKGELADLDVTAATITLTNNLTVNDGPGGAEVTFDGGVVLGGNVTITTDGTNDNRLVFESGASINADNSDANNRTLTILAGSEAVSFGGAVGTGTKGALADLDVTAATITVANNITVNDGPGAADVTFAGAVRLAGNVTITTDGANDNRLVFAPGSSINADDSDVQDRSLTVLAGSQSVSFGGTIGTGTKGALADLDVTASTITLTNDIIINDGVGAADVTFNGAVRLAGNVTISTDGTNDNRLSFGPTATINADNSTLADRSLNILAGSETVSFGGAIGQGANGALADLDVTAATITLASNITVNDGPGGAEVTFDGAIRLAGNVTITTDGVNDNRLNFLAASIDADDSANRDRALTILAGTQSASFGAIGTGVNGALADLDITAATITLTNNVTINDGPGGAEATFSGDVRLANNVTITTDGTNDNQLNFLAASINADDSTNQDRALTILAGTQSASFGALGTGVNGALADLDITAASITLAGDVLVDDGAGGAIVTFTGLVRVAGDVTIDTDGANDNAQTYTGGPTVIVADSSILADRRLTIVAGTESVSFGGAIGSGPSGALADLDVRAASIRLGGDVTVNDGPGGASATFNGAVRLANDVTILTDGANDNSLRFIGGASTIDADDSTVADRQLTITAGSGSVSFGGAIGAGLNGELADLDVTASLILLGNNVVVTDGAGGEDVTFTGAVRLTNSVTITTDGVNDNNLSFAGSSTIDADDATTADRSLTIQTGSATASFGGAIGQGANGALADLDITAATITLADDVVVNDGPGGATVSFNGSVVLAGDVAIVTDGVNDNRVEFTTSSTINADDAGANNRSLTILAGDESVYFGSAVGSDPGGALADFDVTAATITLTDNITANDGPGGNEITFDGAVRLAGNVAINTDGTNDNSLRFTPNSTIDANDALLADRRLNIQAGGASVSLLGDIGTNQSLADLDVKAGTITLAGDIVVNDGPGNATVSFDGPVILAGDVSITTQGTNDNQVEFLGTVDADDSTVSDRKLLVTAGTGTVAFASGIGQSAKGSLADLDITASAISLGGGVRVDDGAGGQTISFSGPVTLTNDVTIDTDGDGGDNHIRFDANSTINADDDTAANRKLTILAGTASVRLGAAVGDNANGALADLDIAASKIVLTQSIRVDDGPGNATATFTGAVVLAGNISIDSNGTNDNSVAFDGTIDADDAGLADRKLLVDAGAGSVTLGGDVGGQANGSLADLDVIGGEILLGGNIRVDDGPGGETITFTGPARLTNNVLIDTAEVAANHVHFSGATSTIDADDSPSQDRVLTIRAGTGDARFDAAIGEGSDGALAALDIAAGTIYLKDNIRADAGSGGDAVILDGPVILQGNVSIDTDGATAGNVRFESTVNADDSTLANRKLTVTSGSGRVTFVDEVGGQPNGALADLDVTAAEISLAANVVVNDQGGQTVTFTGAVRLADHVVLVTDGLVDNNIRFAGASSTIDSANGGPARRLRIDAGTGNVTLEGNVGASDALELFEIGSAGNVSLQGITTRGNLLPYSIDLGTTGITGTLTLGGNLDTTAGANAGSIRINSLGAVRLNANGGAAGTIVLRTNGTSSDGSVVTTGGLNFQSQTAFQDGLTLDVGDQSLDLSAATFTQLDHLVVLVGPTRTVTLGLVQLGDGAGSGGFGALRVDAGATLLLDDIRTDLENNAGKIEFLSTVILSGNIVLDSDAAGVDADIIFQRVITADDASLHDRALTLFSGSAKTYLYDGAGQPGSDSLADLDITAAEILLGGDLVVSDQGNNTVTLTGPVTLLNNLGIFTAGPASSNHLVIDGPIDADLEANLRRLVIATGLGDLTLQGDVGATEALAVFEIGAADDVSLRGVRTIGALQTFTIDIGTGTGLTGELLLGGNLRTDASSDAGGIRISSSGTVRINSLSAGAGTILLDTDASNSDGQIEFVGGFALSSLTPWLDGLTLQLGDNSADLSQSSLTQLDHLVMVAGANQTVTLGALSLGDGAGSAGQGALNVSARTINLTGPVSTSGDTSNVGGDIVLTGATRLMGNITIHTNSASPNDGDVSFVGKVDADNAVANDRSLAIDAGSGVVHFAEDIGLEFAGELADLDVTAATIRIGAANIRVNDATPIPQTVTFNGNVRLENKVALDVAPPGLPARNVTFTGTVNADNSTTQDRQLTVNAAGGAVEFLEDIGAAANGSLARLDVTAQSIGIGGATVRLDDAGGQTSTLTGEVVLRDNVTFDMDGPDGANHLVFQGVVRADDALAQSRSLTVLGGDGDVTFAGNIGIPLGGELADLDVTANRIAIGGDSVHVSDITSGREATFDGTVELRNQVTMRGGNGSPLDNSFAFRGQVVADNSALHDRSLTILTNNGSVSFEQNIGDGVNRALADLDVTAATINLDSLSIVVDDPTTGKLIQFTGTTRIRGNVSIDTDGGGQDNSVAFAGPVQSANSASTDARLTIRAGAGDAQFLGDIGTGTNGALAQLDVQANRIDLRGSTVLLNDAIGATSTFDGVVRLGADVAITTDGTGTDNNLAFLQSVKADDAAVNDRRLQVLGGQGTVTFAQGVGDAIGGSLADLDVTASSIQLSGLFFIDDAGGNSATFTGATILNGDVSMDLDGVDPTDNSLRFAGSTSTINADAAANLRRLEVAAGTGDILLDGNVGLTSGGGVGQALGLFRIRSAGDVSLASISTTGTSVPYTIDLGADSPLSQLTLRGNLSTNVGADAGGIRIQSLGDVRLQAAGAGTAGTIELNTDSAAGTDGAILFLGGGTVRSENAYQDGLTLIAGDRSIDISGVSLLELDHLVVRTGTGQTVTLGQVTLGDGQGAGASHALDVVAGTTRLAGNVSTAGDPSGTAGEISLQSNVIVVSNVLITSDASTDRDIVIRGTINADDATLADRTLAIVAGNATVDISGNIGSAPNGSLADLDITAGSILLGASEVRVDDSASGNQVRFDGVVTLRNSTLFDTDSTGFDNDLYFAGQVRSDNIAGQPRTLTATAGTARVTFNDTVGVGGAFSDLDVQGGMIVLNGNVQVDAQGGNVATLQGDVRLLRNITIDTDGTADNSFRLLGATSQINGDLSANQRTLTFVAGTGDVLLDGAVGSAETLGALTINSVRDFTASASIASASLQQLAGTGNTRLLALVQTTGAVGVDLTTSGAIQVAGGISTKGGGIVRFAQGNGLTITGDIDADGAVSEVGAGQVTIGTGRQILTTGDTILFTNDMRLTGGNSGIANLDTTIGGNTNGANVTLRGTVDATTPAPQAEQLRINAGTGGDIRLEDTVGGNAALGGVAIVSARDVTVFNGLEATFINQLAGTGTTLLRGAVKTGGGGISLNTNGNIEIASTITTTGGGSVTFVNGQLLTVNGNIQADGTVQQLGLGPVALATSRSVTTTGDLVSFQGPVTLFGASGTFTINTTAAGASGGDIRFLGSVDSAVSPANARELSLGAGTTGNILFQGVVGGLRQLDGITIAMARDVAVQGNITTSFFEQTNGTGNTILSAPLRTTGEPGAVIRTQGAIIVNSQVTVTNSDVLTLRSGADINLSPGSKLILADDSANAKLILDAGQNLNFDPLALIQVGTNNPGTANSTKPLLDVQPTFPSPGVNINGDGLAEVDVRIGNPNTIESNVVVVVNWNDPPLTIRSDLDGSGNTYRVEHTYLSNPGPDPTSPISISVLASFDPRIVMTEQAGTVRLGRSAVDAILLPPTSGLLGFNVVIQNFVAPFREPEVRSFVLPAPPQAPIIPVVQRIDLASSASVASNVPTRKIVLHVVLLDNQGRPTDSDPIELNNNVLDNLPELFQSLPDDRYRIYMQMENGSRRLIKDFVIRDRKAIDLDETPDDERMPQTNERPLDQDQEKEPPEIEAAVKPRTAPFMRDPGADGASREADHRGTPGSRRAVTERVDRGSARVEQPSTEGISSTEGPAEAAAAGAALAAAAELLSRHRGTGWSARVRGTLKSLARAARGRVWPGSIHQSSTRQSSEDESQ